MEGVNIGQSAVEKISVIIITLNEEENIRGCLESVKWADDIVILDSESTDKTVEICREYTDRVYIEKAWHGFGKQKNLCIEKAKGPWILNIDADERVTPELGKEIVEILSGRQRSCNGFNMPRKSFFLGKWIRYCGWYPDYNLRLFRKNKGLFSESLVHESVKIQGKAEFLRNPLEHYTYKSIDDYLCRMNKYARLAAEEMSRNGKSVNYFDLLSRPLITFLKMFLLRRGFLEGYRGLILSYLYASYTLSKYSKLWEMKKK